MKKSTLLIAIVSLFVLTAKAQLANTKWRGAVKLPVQGGELVDFQTLWNFQQDTLTIVYTGGKLPIDVMTYSEDSSKIVSIRKVSGGVPCDNSDVGKFSYVIKDDQMFLTKIEDPCVARGAVDVSRPFKKILKVQTEQ